MSLDNVQLLVVIIHLEMWDLLFQMYFVLVGLFLVIMTFVLYFRQEWNVHQEGLSTANITRLAAITYALEQIPKTIPVDDYAAIRDNVQAMIGLTNQLEVTNPLNEKAFQKYRAEMQNNVDMCLKTLQEKNASKVLKEQIFDLIMDSLNNNFTLPY